MSNKIKVIVQLKETKALHNFSASPEAAAKNINKVVAAVPANPLFTMDTSFGVVNIPAIDEDENVAKGNKNAAAAFEVFSDDEGDAADSTYIVRGEVDEENIIQFQEEMLAKEEVVGVFADVAIEPQLVCPGTGPVGTHLDVERLLCVPKMKSKGMDGSGVTIAIVDTGVNMAYLNAHGKTPNFNAGWSWKPSSSAVVPGSAPVGHGTMCAFDVCIAAPKCTLLDIALLSTNATGPTIMSGFLSDAVKAYEHLINYIGRRRRPGENGSLVVNNSWGMFHPSWDFPVGNPGNFSHNPNHPFNLITKKLALKGADIIFAAGNCGPECPDGRCQNVTNAGIYGANSSRYVTCVTGVATNLDRVGYSNSGPGNLSRKKPDITGYTHFAGSGVYSADGGTSAACPVVAGVVGAIRSKRPFIAGSAITSPASIRNLLRSTANDLGASGYDYLYGYGVINGCKIVKKLFPLVFIHICERYPHICDLIKRDKIRFLAFCKQYPHLCRRINPDKFKLPLGADAATATEDEADDADILEALDAFFSEGTATAEGEETATSTTEKTGGCNCHD